MTNDYKLDRNGFVTIKNGKKTARVLPESVPAWLGLGWKVGRPEDSGSTPADDANKPK